MWVLGNNGSCGGGGFSLLAADVAMQPHTNSIDMLQIATGLTLELGLPMVMSGM